MQAGNMDIHILNMYIPPVSACKARYSASIQALLSENKIIVGDFNAHHSSWYSNLTPDSRGRNFADELENSDFNVVMIAHKR